MKNISLSLILLKRSFAGVAIPKSVVTQPVEKLEDTGWDIILQKYFENLNLKMPSLLALPQSSLPYERTVIEKAILATWHAREAESPFSREKLETGYTMLSRFIPDDDVMIVYEAEELAQNNNQRGLRQFWQESGSRLNEILKQIHEREESYASLFTQESPISHENSDSIPVPVQ